MVRRIGALIILIALLTVPFINWRVGAWLWLCAGLVHIFQRLFAGRTFLPQEAAPPELDEDEAETDEELPPQKQDGGA